MAGKLLDDVGVKHLWDKVVEKIGEETSAIEEKLTSLYKFKGSVDDLTALKALPKESLTVGDVYNVKDSGMNYAWTGEEGEYDEGWDQLGGMIDIPTLSTEEIDKLIEGE